jgi:sugar lactone lactonase YvrE
MSITRVDTVTCRLGEGPVWDARDQALWFVDIFGQHVHRYSPGDGTTRSWDMPANVGAVAPCRDRGAVVALADGIHALDLESGATTPVALVDDLPPGVALNDGKVDRRGRFVVGTIDTKIAAPLGQFLSLQAGRLRVIADGFTVGNGPCWSPDDRVLYLADSFARRIYSYDYDIETGDVGDRRIFAGTQALGGIPDGATVDEEGMVWVAICEGAKVVAFAPDGEVQRVIEMPVSHPSSVTFGGPGLDLLYVTSIDPVALGKASEPSGGMTFVIDGLGARGLEETRYLP